MRYMTGVGLVLAAGVVWSVQGALIRGIDHAESWSVLFWRSLATLPALALWIGPSRILPAIRAMGWAGLVGGVGLVFAYGGAIAAMQATTIANAVLLFSASPFFAAVLGWLVLGEKVRPLTWGAICLALVGIAIMVGGIGQIGGTNLFGTLAALISALGFAAFTVALRWGHVTNTLPAVFLGGCLAVLTGLVMAGLTGQALIVPASDILLAFVMGAFTITGGMVLYTLGSRVVPAAQATLLSMTEVLLAPIWAWAVFDERISSNTALGGAVLIGAVLINAFAGGRGSVARATISS